MKERKTAQIVTRVTEDDRAWVDREADKQGLDPSSFIRMTLRRVRAASAEQPTAPQAV
jgi:antitoxin component of RelBE/YafQ-DinJ toxin-antitoxin module